MLNSFIVLASIIVISIIVIRDSVNLCYAESKVNVK